MTRLGMLTSEGQNVHIWQWCYTIPEQADVLLHMLHSFHSVQHAFPRLSLQDCMEATRGAALLTGGVEMALRMSDALGMSVGGLILWSVRYSRPPEALPIPPLFADLQADMGYEFHPGQLLIEVVTHPSFATSASASYQRLEIPRRW